MASIHELLDTWGAMDVAAWAGHRYGWIMPDGNPITLAAWQRALLSCYAEHKADVSTLFISSVKKTGKTALNSIILCHRWLTLPGLHLSVGNDRDQSAELQFDMVRAMCQRHPLLRRHVRETRTELTFEPTGSRVVALPMDYKSSGGTNFGTVSLSELWAYEYESARRLYEELTPIPGDCLRIVDSYAGYENEGETLKAIWQRGLSGASVSENWPVFLTGRQLSYIHDGTDAQERCWLGDPSEREAYYAEQRATLRPATYQRLHLNQWVSSESAFVTPDQWDTLVDADYRCPDSGVSLYCGLDIGVKSDRTAVASVWCEDGRIFLGPYRIFPSPIDWEAVESYVLDLAGRYAITSLMYDPYQCAHLASRLSSHVRMVEFPQTTARLTESGNFFFDAIRQRRLVVYPGADDLRTHVLNAAAKETPRGIRLVKSGTGKIDASIALAMAVMGAREPAGVFFRVLDLPDPTPTPTPGGDSVPWHGVGRLVF